MKTLPLNFEGWPRTKGGDPIFSTTKNAFLYAHLIIDKVSERTRIVKARELVLSRLKVMRANDTPNLQRMMDLAIKGQFYRECLEEVERIESDKSKF